MLAEDVNEALDEQAAELLAEAAVAEPPIDMLHVARRLGFVVAVDDRLAVRARHVQLPAYECDPGRAAILLKPDPRAERRQWAVAHEIGEHHVHAVFARLGWDADSLPVKIREQVVNALANRMLLPGAWFFPDGARLNWDLAALKRRYPTASYELIARRMLEADVPVIVTIFDQGEVRFRRSNGPGPVPRLSEVERGVRDRAGTLGRIQQQRNARCWVRVWPIHEPSWKREIMRTEWSAAAGDEFD